MPDGFPSHHRDVEVWTSTVLFTLVKDPSGALLPSEGWGRLDRGNGPERVGCGWWEANWKD